MACGFEELISSEFLTLGDWLFGCVFGCRGLVFSSFLNINFFSVIFIGLAVNELIVFVGANLSD
jgi:hypothetical protein